MCLKFSKTTLFVRRKE